MRDYKDLNDYEIMYMIGENNDDAMSLLFDKYRPLVLKIAKDYYRIGKKYGLELDDFIQEGYYALFCAIKNYSDNKNILFYTYATVSIKSKMKNLIKNGNTSKNKALNESISLYDNIKYDTIALIDCIDDNNSLNPDTEIEKIEFREEIKQALYELSFEDSLIFELKINGFNNMDISKLLNMDYSLISRRLNKIRKNFKVLVEKK